MDFKNPHFSSKLWQFLLFSLAFAMFVSAMPLFLERRLTWAGRPFGPEQAGHAWVLAGFFGVIGQGPALGRLADDSGSCA